MSSVDKAAGEAHLSNAWRALGHRIAVAGACAVALFSLFLHVPPTTAALRGAGTWLALLFATRLGVLALRQALRLEHPVTDAKEDS